MSAKAEAIEMIERRFSWFPLKFSWRGRIYEVDAVNECKTVTNRWDQCGMHHYWVRSGDQLFHLCEVLPRSQWVLFRE